jgi:alkylation response protein AidB-like acyl-CoA dehydrogenase
MRDPDRDGRRNSWTYLHASIPCRTRPEGQAREVDAAGAFPQTAVDALRASGLLGLTLPADAGGLAGGPRELVVPIGRAEGWFDDGRRF